MNAVANSNADTDTEPASTGDGTPQPLGSDDPPTELSKDELFHLLQNQRRRRVLLYLQDTSGDVSMRDIAEQVAAWENDTTIEALGSNERQRVYIALYQSHLPKLDDAGVLTYDQQRGIVSRTQLANQLETYLNVETTERERDETDAQNANDDSTDANTNANTNTDTDTNTDANTDVNLGILRYYGAATLASVLSTAASGTGIITMSGSALATFITGLFVAVTAGLLIQQRHRIQN